MDYNDNDYEDQNLHLAGEESSKVSSVLQPFTLPKFDFDDNLHGNLRFDSLVGNEVFLDIPSQEDNQWIEDFSRGSGEIVFSSGATESCALPRCNNVWSEATSSESVEMLLKAVGQEEMVPGETVVEESDPVNQLDSSTSQMEHTLKPDGKIDVFDDTNSSLLTVEAVVDISRSNITADMDGIHAECLLQANETKLASCSVENSEECSLIVGIENLRTGLKSTSDNTKESSGLLHEPLMEKVLPFPGIGIVDAEGSSQMTVMSYEEIDVQDRVSDTDFVSASSVGESIFVAVTEQNVENNTSDHHGTDAETVNLEMHHPAEIHKKLVSVEDGAVHIHDTTIVESPSHSEKSEFVSSFDGPNETAFNFEPLGVRETGDKVLSSQEIDESEGCIKSPQKSSILIEGGFVEGSYMNESNAGGLDKSIASSYTATCCMEKAFNEVVTDVGYAKVIQEDHVSPPYLSIDTQIGREGIPSVLGDVQECKRDVLICDKGGSKLHLGSTVTPLDDVERESGRDISCQGLEENIETAGGSHINATTENFPVLGCELKDKMLTSPHIQAENLADCHDCGTRSPDMENTNKNQDVDFESNEELVTSALKESLDVADEFTPGVQTEKSTLPDSASAKESRTVDHSDFSLDTSTSSLLVKDGDLTEPSACDLIVKNDLVEATPSDNPKGAEVERSVAANHLIVPATVSAVELGEPNQLSPAFASFTELPQSRVSNLVNLKDGSSKSIGGSLSSSLKSGVNSFSEEEGTFTFDIRHLESHSIGGSGTSLPSIPVIQVCKPLLSGEGSPSTSGSSSKVDPMTMKKISHVGLLVPDGKSLSGGHTNSTEGKSRRRSSKSGKDNVKKGNQVKEVTPLRQTERGDKSLGPLSPLMAGQILKYESILQPRGPVCIPTSGLPDLNTSVASAFFHQPFTDLQQVQLRAQIFVYGSLIQGVAPDEACMVSSFDGNRSIWEPTWRASVHRLNGQKSVENNTETPARSCTGALGPDQINRQTFPKTEVLSSPAIRPSNKSTLSSVVNPMISLSSPLWNISTPSCESLPSSSMSRTTVFDYHVVSPLHSFQRPPIQNLVAQTTSWASQAPFPVPWIASSQTSPFDASSNFTAFPITEPIRFVTPIKESFMPLSSGTKLTSSISAIHSGGKTIIPGTSSDVDLKNVTVSAGQIPANSKARKRKKSSGAEDAPKILVTASPADSIPAAVVSSHLSKKASAVEDLSEILMHARGQADLRSTPVVNSHYCTAVTVSTPSIFLPKGSSDQLSSAGLSTVPIDHHNSGDLSMDGRELMFPDFGKVEEAKLQAEEASILSAAAVNHCQVLWSQLEQQKSSGLTSETEATLASSAVAIAAAASVAKAAAAAAKIAYNAAIQAKQMADEAAASRGSVSNVEYDKIRVSSSPSHFENATPVSILKGGERNHPSNFVISAASKAARKRVEVASAATCHAENLDAILKAAELAADAVSHAGKIVTMGDPLPLSELMVAGPDDYWKISHEASLPYSKLNKVNPEKRNVGKGSAKNMHVTSHDMFPLQNATSENILNDHISIEESAVAPARHWVRKDRNVPDSEKGVGIGSELHSPTKYDSATTIKEGSRVEVLKDHCDTKQAWHLAHVLSLKDGEALVSYDKLQSDQGSDSESLKEWVPLEGKDGNPALVRIPHPMSMLQFEGVRKRRRAAVKDYDWSVGDKVDALVHDCWREGIVAENGKNDPTALSVHFPAQRETLVVKVWHLRPTVIWMDGQWIEWCRSGLDRMNELGDTPKEKRAKLGDVVTERNVKGKVSENIDTNGIGKNEEPKLPLSANERAFNIGISKDGNKPSMVNNMRSGLQKEGSRGVVFGVPKPGKKRKFMEVSKHYVHDRSTKVNVPSDSVKLSTFLTPLGSGSKGLNISRNKSSAEVKPKFLKSGKQPTFPCRTLPEKDGSTSSQQKANDDIEPNEQNLAELGSLSTVSEGKVIFSSQALEPENHNKTSTAHAKSVGFNKGKLAPVSRKPAKKEENEKSISEAAEPRRSNRRIQPTSRLLEGLQSSLSIAKLPSSSHDKSNSEGTSKAR